MIMQKKKTIYAGIEFSQFFRDFNFFDNWVVDTTSIQSKLGIYSNENSELLKNIALIQNKNKFEGFTLLKFFLYFNKVQLKFSYNVWFLEFIFIDEPVDETLEEPIDASLLTFKLPCIWKVSNQLEKTKLNFKKSSNCSIQLVLHF